MCDSFPIFTTLRFNSIWLISAARELPLTIEFDGLDISLEQCPPRSFFPQNIKLQAWDMFTDPPQNLIEQFDIVHVRLIMLVIKDNDPLPIIHNLWKLLSKLILIFTLSFVNHAKIEPRGYLQWDEVDSKAVYIEKTNPSIPTTAIDTMFHTFTIPKHARGSDE